MIKRLRCANRPMPKMYDELAPLFRLVTRLRARRDRLHDRRERSLPRDQTVAAHCRKNGVALLQPDHVRQTFRPSRESGWHRVDRRSVRYVELTQATRSSRKSTTDDYTFTIKWTDSATRVITDRHHTGVFARAPWFGMLREHGFSARAIVDPWKRFCFLAQRFTRATRRPRTRSKRETRHTSVREFFFATFFRQNFSRAFGIARSSVYGLCATSARGANRMLTTQ